MTAKQYITRHAATGYLAGVAASNAVTAMWRALFATEQLSWIGPTIWAATFATFAVINARLTARKEDR